MLLQSIHFVFKKPNMLINFWCIKEIMDSDISRLYLPDSCINKNVTACFVRDVSLSLSEHNSSAEHASSLLLDSDIVGNVREATLTAELQDQCCLK